MGEQHTTRLPERKRPRLTAALLVALLAAVATVLGMDMDPRPCRNS